MSIFKDKPTPFFDLAIHDLGRMPSFTFGIAGYEQKQWRDEAMANYLFEWLPEFALKYSELEDFNSGTGMRLIKKAAKTVYTTDKYQKRGEFGELLLHALIREVFSSEPAISKIYYKTAANDTVKGFDAVHVVENSGELELWLGEVKFYKKLREAIRDVVPELKKHTERDYLRDEFILIASKIDDAWAHADKLRQLISERTSLDVLFKRTCVPVLLTYESDCVDKHTESCSSFSSTVRDELEDAYKAFCGQALPKIKVHLFLVPMHKKEALVRVLHEKLEGLQR